MKSLSFDAMVHKRTIAASPPPNDLPRSRCCIDLRRAQGSGLRFAEDRDETAQHLSAGTPPPKPDGLSS